jgi:glycosyltransferase involved in cell wall biosynthesis/GT2 family glycosyltransferase
LGIKSKIDKVLSKFQATWKSPHVSLKFKLNWTIQHSWRLFKLVLVRLINIILDPNAIKRLLKYFIYVAKNTPGMLRRKLAPRALKRRIKIIWFSIRPKYSVLDANQSPNISGEDVTVILPVYGQIHVVRYLFDQLEKEQKSFPFKLLVIDDAYDEQSTKWLKTRLSKWDKAELIVNPTNMGYLKSINKAVSQTTTKYCVLLNSDIEINKNGIQRIAAALIDPGVALATALATDSGANLSIAIPKGRHWIEIDNWLNGVRPLYPDAHTAIGYALAVNLELMDRSELFSNDFIDGYGEDSDLHFRALEKGYRSVIADNVLVRHHSGLSYGTKDDLSATKQKNVATFKNKWGAVHLKGLRKWESRNPLHKIEGFIRRTHKKTNQSADFLILIPSLDDHSGGSKMVIALFEKLWRTGRTARLLSTIRDIHRNSAWSSVSGRAFKNSQFPNVITTGSGTFENGTNQANRLNARRILFFQGPEMFFDNGAYFGRTLKHLSKTDLAICNSPYVEQLAQTFGVSNTCVVPLGPDTDRFFRDVKIQKTNKVLISSRLNADKATVLSIPLAISFLNLGYQVETFGFTTDALKLIPGIQHHGQISPTEMNRLMNESKFLIDTSIFEGLGLTPLEALRAHCIPVVTRKGGLESVNPPKDWMVWLESPYISQEELYAAIREAEGKSNRSPAELDSFFEDLNLESGISAAVKSLESY